MPIISISISLSISGGKGGEGWIVLAPEVCICICWWLLIVQACDVHVQESVESFRPRGRGGEPRASLLGKVVMIDTFTASADMNPYGLPLGTE